MILPFLKSLCLSIYHYFYLSIYQSILYRRRPGCRYLLLTQKESEKRANLKSFEYNILYNAILWKDGFWTWKRYLIENCYLWKLFQLHLAVQHRHESLLLGLISRHLLSNARQVQSHVWQESRYLQVKHSFAKFMFQIDPSLTPSLVPERWYRTSANNLSTFEAIYKYF